MPSHYAHYRFGALSIACMSPEIRCRVQRFRQLYDVGLHGPDLFFYHNIFVKDTAVNLGSKFHRQTGQEFFTRVCKHLRLEPSEAAMVYLYGLLGHYCLDSVCHPFVNEIAGEGSIGHVELETEFDRHLLTLDGKQPPNTFDCSPHMKLTRGECVTVSDFYPPATPAMVSRSVRGMAFCTRFLASPPGLRRRLLNMVVKVSGDKFSQHVMTRSPNPKCSHLNAALQALYDQALEKYPSMLQRLCDHLTSEAPLGEDFERIFG